MRKSLLQKVVGAFLILVLSISSLAAFVPVQKVSADYPGGDCDTNAVIRCGVNSIGELKDDYRANQGGNVQAVFNYFHIPNESYFDGMVRGRVTKTNEVWVGNTKVATGAVTAGRKNMPGSTAILGGQFYMRNPAVSFRSDSLEAFVKMDGETFRYAVILSCGNPVNAFPTVAPKPQPKPQPQPQPQPKKPDLEIKKDVRGPGVFLFQQEITANPGDELHYMITVRNTGETDLQNVRVHDSLPEGVSFEDTELDIAPEGTNLNLQLSDLVGEGVNLGTIPKGGIRQITFTVTVGDDAVSSDDAADATTEDSSGSGGMAFEQDASDDSEDETESTDTDDKCVTLRNVAHAEADDVAEKEDDALVEICEQEQPEQPEEEEEVPPQVKGKQTPPSKLPDTGIAGAAGIFSITSFLGWTAYKLKEFYSVILR